MEEHINQQYYIKHDDISEVTGHVVNWRVTQLVYRALSVRTVEEQVRSDIDTLPFKFSLIIG